MKTTKLYEDILASANLLNGQEYKDLFATTAQVVSDIVVQTLGPYGSTTIIDDGSGFTYPTKDGWSCLNRIRFNDPLYNTFFGIIKQVSFNSVSTVGDGTTTAMVCTSNFLKYMNEKLLPELGNHPSYSQALLLDGMKEAAANIEEAILKSPNIIYVDPAGDFKEIYNVAKIATNGNVNYAKFIQEIYQETGNPNIRVEIDKSSPETSYAIETGYRFDCPTIGFRNYINDELGVITRDNDMDVVIFDHNVTYNMHKLIIPALSNYIQAKPNRYLLILAPYFDDIIMSIINSQVEEMRRNGAYPTIMLSYLPNASANHREVFNDLAVITNSVIMTESYVKAFNILYQNQTLPEDDKITDDMMELAQFKKYATPIDILDDCTGRIAKATFTKNEAYIRDFDQIANPTAYQNLLNEIKEQYDTRKEKANKTINGFLDHEYLATQLRYIKLLGNSGVIKVGGISDIQKRCDKDSLDDAVLACRSAYENGYTRGMNLETIAQIQSLIKPDSNFYNNTLNRFINQIYMAFLYAYVATTASIFKNKDHRVEVIAPEIFYLADEGINTNDKDALDQAYSAIPFTNEQTKEVYSTIAAITLDTRSVVDYDFTTGCTHEKGEWEVINSVATDIEIMKAISNIMTTFITSSQFLTTARNCDIKVSSRKALEDRADDEAYIAERIEYAKLTARRNYENIPNSQYNGYTTQYTI